MVFILYLLLFYWTKYALGHSVIKSSNDTEVINNIQSNLKGEVADIPNVYGEVNYEAVKKMGEDFDKYLFGNEVDDEDFYSFKLKKAVNKPPSDKQEITQSRVDPLNFYRAYVHYLIKKERYRLERIAYLIKHRLHIKSDKDIIILQNVTNHFIVKLRKYSNFLSNLNLNNDLDKELMFYDLIETANKLLYYNSITFLDRTVDKNNLTQEDIDYEMFLHEIKQQTFEEKKLQMDYICQVLSICRPFPSYVDHVIELLDLILDTPENKFEEVIKLFDKLVRRNIVYFRSLMTSNVADLIGPQLEIIFQKMNTAKDYLTVIYNTVANSFKVFQIADKTVLTKYKAVRILIDLINKTFDKMGDDMVDMELRTVKKIFKHWVAGYRNQIDELLEFYFESVVGAIKYYIDKKTKREFEVIFDVLTTGSTVDYYVYKYLFTKGSLTGPNNYEDEFSISNLLEYSDEASHEVDE